VPAARESTHEGMVMTADRDADAVERRENEGRNFYEVLEPVLRRLRREWREEWEREPCPDCKGSSLAACGECPCARCRGTGKRWNDE
jgi:hypothetical protein